MTILLTSIDKRFISIKNNIIYKRSLCLIRFTLTTTFVRLLLCFTRASFAAYRLQHRLPIMTASYIFTISPSHYTILTASIALTVMPALGPLISYLTFLPEDRYIVDRLLPPWVKKDQFIDLHIGIMDLANIFSPGAYATGIIRGDYSAHHDDWLHDISAVAVKAHFKDVAERLFTGPAAMFQSVPSALYPKEEPWYSIEESQQEDCAGMVRVHLRLQCSRLWTERGRLERNLSGLEAALGMMMDV